MRIRNNLVGATAIAINLVLGCGSVDGPGDQSGTAQIPPSRLFRQASIAGGSLEPASIPKFVEPLVIPPAMPRTAKLKGKGMTRQIDYYEIAVRQFEQQILPPPLPATTVWSYGSLTAPGTVAQGGSFHYPAFTIEAKYQAPVRVKWVNDLVDDNGDYLPHLLPVDQTLHWANPVGECAGHSHSMMQMTDCRGTNPLPYAGPVPIVTHVHGAETFEWSDGFPEAWYLPAANDIPAGYARHGSYYQTFKDQAAAYDPVPPAPGRGGLPVPYPIDWEDGSATFEYPNEMRATTLWYHDHTLGMTRLNVYAGPAGFYLLRGGPADEVLDTGVVPSAPAVLPGPAPALGDSPGMAYYEIPIAIQDRSFNDDGSLFYPRHRAFFENLEHDQLQIPFIPEMTPHGMSDVSPIWNPEFFGNTIVVNGKTWPYLNVEPRRYRFRLLNGTDSRFLILHLDNPDVPIWQIGADGGFLPAPVHINAASEGRILLGPAERADVIVDFSAAPGTSLTMLNIGPDEPFGGGVPDVDFPVADPDTTGQVMRFNVSATPVVDPTTPPQNLQLPAITPLATAGATTRRLSLNEADSMTVFVSEDEHGNVVHAPESDSPFGPSEARLGTLDADGFSIPSMWSDPISENPGVGTTEVWEFYNFTMDAHPMHIHLVQFQVVNREGLMSEEGMAMQPAMLMGNPRGPEPAETGFKDTVIAYPGEVTRVVARFDHAGLFVWHCHIIEHEDNEMMRPFCVGTSPGCMQANGL